MAILRPLPVTFKSKAVGGKLPDIDRGLFAYVIEQCEGKDINLTLDFYVQKRSNAQNSYYWPVIIEYVLEGLIDAGYRRDTLDSETVHTFLKNKFLKHTKRRVRNPLTKKYIITPPSTTKLSTWYFMDYMDAVRQWAAEFLSINIPDPNKEWREQAERDYNEAIRKGLISPDERNRVRIALKLSA